MGILKVGEKCTFNVELKVLKAFAYEDDLYYIVVVLKKNTILRNTPDPIWGCLNVDKSCEEISEEVMARATEIVKTLDLNNLE